MPLLLFNFSQYNLLINTIVYLIVILTLILITVLIIEKRIKKRIRKRLSTNGIIFMKALRTIENFKSPYQRIVLISHLSKQIFKELFKLNFFPTFEEAKKLAKQKNFYEIEQFCNRMTELIYTGKKPNEEEGFEMLSRIGFIIKRYMLIKELPQITKQAEKPEKEKIGQNQVIKPMIKQPPKSELIKKPETKEVMQIPVKAENPASDDEKKLRMISASIAEGRKKLQERDAKAAYQYYNTARILYAQLDKDKKALCTQKLLAFYKDILASFIE